MSDQAPGPPTGAGGGSSSNSKNSTSSGASSSSSFMSQFYTPMNPTFVSEPTPQPPPVNHSTPVPVSAPSLGAGAALLLANLTTIPGFLSDAVIQEARQEYSNQQQQQQQQHPPTFTHNYNSEIQPAFYSHSTSTNDNLEDSNAKIGSLLMELQGTGQPTQSSWSNSASLSTLSTTTPPPAQPPHQTPEALVPEDYSNGKITPQLLKRLASIAESDAQQGGTLLKEIKALRERQIKTERSLFEKREAILAKHKRDLVKLQANEIMGVNVTGQMQQIKTAHTEELKQFDMNVVYELDKEITTVQRSLSKSGVPMMSCTSDPKMINAQIRVLRLLEDMLQS